MRNLKRALSLVLAVVMVIGLMVVGASAVSYNDFSDRGEIVNKDAVSMLTTLEIIEGLPDGSYDPTGDVDRAMMAKMISVALTNNEDCDTLYTNVNSGLTDISANWARGYINYCYVRGIIAGRGDNTFDPSANVTGVEAAKMLLAALGYNAEIEGLVGPDWALNTAALAQQLGIFRNFTKDVSEPLSRDDAALLIYNALDVEMIQQYSNGYALVYSDHRTILSSVFGVMRVEGVVVGNEWAQLEGTNSAAALREGRTNLDNVVVYDSTTANTTVPEGIEYDDVVPFNVSTPVDMIGKAVTMYVEKTTILSNANVIGIATNDDMNVIVSTADGADDEDELLDGTGISLGRDTQYYVNYGWCEDQAEAIDIIGNEDPGVDHNVLAVNGVNVEVIDNDDDGTAEYVLYTQETLSEVIRYNERDEILSFYRSNLGSDRIYEPNNNTNTPDAVRVDFEDVVFEDEVATDDVILYVEYGGRTYVKLADTVTGTMTRLDRDRNDELYITIDNGDTYYQSFIRDEASDVDVDIEDFDIDASKTRDDAPGFDTAFDFFLDSNGFIVALRPAEEVVTNYALVLDSAWTLNALERSGQVEILSADGTTGTYTIDWNDSRDVFSGTNSQKNSALEDYLGSRDVQQDVDGDEDVDDIYRTGRAAGSIITYSLDEDNVLTIERIMQGNNLMTFNDDDDDNLEIIPQNTSTTAGVGDKGAIFYANPDTYTKALDADDSDDHHTGHVACTAQYEVVGGYDNGDGSITVTSPKDNYGGQNKVYAVDRNTVAFYYWTDTKGTANPDDDEVCYEVLTGWNEMSSVDEGTHVQVYPVLTKTADDTYEASNLAGVVLFEAETQANNRDYLLVLNRNAYTTGNTLWLNVVFEDGSVEEIEVDDAPVDFEDPDHFMTAYAYTQNSDGTYDLSAAGGTVYQGNVYADLLRVGTVAYYTDADENGRRNGSEAEAYIAYTQGEANVWDVTGVTNASQDVASADFRENVEVHAVIVDDDAAIRTAWIWDVEEDADPTPEEPEDPDLSVTVMDDVIVVDNPTGASRTQIANAIADALEDEGYTEFDFSDFVDNNKVTATDGRITVPFDVVYAELTQADAEEALEKAVEEGGTVYLGSGTFELDTTDLTKDITIIGSGNTVIEATDKVNSPILLNINAEDINVTISGVKFVNNDDYELAIQNQYLNTSKNYTVTITDCTFEGFPTAIQLRYLAGGSITDCTFTGSTNADISIAYAAGEFEISDNTYTRGLAENIGIGGDTQAEIDNVIVRGGNPEIGYYLYE